jgi:hypothetical protein
MNIINKWFAILSINAAQIQISKSKFQIPNYFGFGQHL